MQFIKNPNRQQWNSLVKRPVVEGTHLLQIAAQVYNQVLEAGDQALHLLTAKFDQVNIDQFEVSAAEFDQAAGEVPLPLQRAIQEAAKHIEKFHAAQIHAEPKIETLPGVTCWRKPVPIEKVGLYVPGGTAPLFSTVLMLAIPAKLAGCKQIIMCTPPQPDGKINAAVLYAARLAGVHKVFKLGGSQAICAMAIGTESIPKVYKILGPGNQYVTAAKQYVQQKGVAIDMPAGPSEVCAIADETAVPAFIAADLLSQAEHGADSQVMLLCTPRFDLTQMRICLQEQLSKLPRAEFANDSLLNSTCIVFDVLEDLLDFVNAYAPEHLIIAMKQPELLADQVVNAGSVFLGNYSPESAGDYASGTNHTLPTNGFAKAFAGVSVDSFVKKITFQQITETGLQQLAPTIITMAEAEGLDAHAAAVQIRVK